MAQIPGNSAMRSKSVVGLRSFPPLDPTGPENKNAADPNRGPSSLHCRVPYLTQLAEVKIKEQSVGRRSDY